MSIEIISCRNGHPNASGQAFCGDCGIELSAMALITPTAKEVAPEPNLLKVPRSRRRYAISAGVVALTVLAVLGIGYKTASDRYYVSAYGKSWCYEDHDKNDRDCDNVAIMRGIPGSVLGIPLQQLYFLGCLNDRGELFVLHRRGEVFARASFDTQQAELHCERMRLKDLQPSERPQLAAGFQVGSLDDAMAELQELAHNSLLPLCSDAPTPDTGCRRPGA